jgi:transposase
MPMDVLITGRILRGGYDQEGRHVLRVDGINTPNAPFWVALRLVRTKGWHPLPARPGYAWLIGTLGPELGGEGNAEVVVDVQAIVPSTRRLPPRIRFRGYGSAEPAESVDQEGHNDKRGIFLVEPSSRDYPERWRIEWVPDARQPVVRKRLPVVVSGRLEPGPSGTAIKLRATKLEVLRHLSFSERRALDRAARVWTRTPPRAQLGSRRPRRLDRRRIVRVRVIRLWRESGLPPAKIARRIGRSLQTVERMIREWRVERARSLRPLRRAFTKPGLLTTPILRWLHYLLSYSPRYFGQSWQSWTVRSVGQYLRDRGCRVGRGTVHNALVKINAGYVGGQWQVVRSRRRTAECRCGKRYPIPRSGKDALCPECFALRYLRGQQENLRARR